MTAMTVLAPNSPAPTRGLSAYAMAPVPEPVPDADAGEQVANQTGGLLDNLDLAQLCEVKAVFETTTDDQRVTYRSLTEAQFSTLFHEMTRESNQELGKLFMKIDCNSGGKVTWEEFLSFVRTQQLFRAGPEQGDDVEVNRYSLVDESEPPAMGIHRETAVALTYVHRCSAYVSASHDGTLRFWNATSLKTEAVRYLADKASAVPVNSMNQLPQALAKLAVATADRMVSFWELADLPGSSTKYGLFGKMHLAEIPVALESWTLGGGRLHCLAVGDVAGCVHIYDAGRLVERLRLELGRAHQLKRDADPRPLSQHAVLEFQIATLQLHDDWVSQIHFAPGINLLITASLDVSIRVTRLDLPAALEARAGSEPKDNTGGWAPPAPQAGLTLERENFRPAHTMFPPAGKGVHAFVCNSGGLGRRQLASCGLERAVHVWNLESGDLLKSLHGHRANVTSLAYDPASDLLVSLDTEGVLRTWDFHQLIAVRSSRRIPAEIALVIESELPRPLEG